MPQEKKIRRLLIEQKDSIMLLVILLVYILLSCITQSIPIVKGILFLLYQIFCVLIPGMALLILLRVEQKSDIAFISFSYAVGTIFSLLQYFLLATLHLFGFAPVMSLVVSIVSFGFLAKKYSKLQLERDRSGWKICSVFWCIVLIVDFLSVSCVNRMPLQQKERNGFYVDWLFWIGNSISFTKSFPVQDFRLCGESFNYHYFSSILMAQTSLVTGINVTQLSLYFSNICTAFLLVFGAYVLFKSAIRRKCLIVWALGILFFTDGSIATGMWHLFFCPFGFDYACAFGMFALFMLVRFIKENSYHWGEVLLSALFIAMTTGCKGPIGIVILSGYGLVALSLLLKKKWKKGFLCGGIWLSAFLVIYLLFIHGEITSGNAGLQILGVAKAFFETPWTREMYNSLSGRYGVGGLFLKIILEVLFIFLQNVPIICLFILSLCVLVRNQLRRKNDYLLLLTSAICIFGILLTINTYQAGGSQIYFVHAIFPAAILGGFYAIDRYVTEQGKWKRSIAILIGLLLSLHGGKIAIGRNIIPMAEKGIACAQGTNEVMTGYPYLDLTSEDLEAYSWIKENTNSNAILAIDTFYIEESGRLQNMVAGVFAERFVWNDGKYSSNVQEVERRKSIVERFKSGDETARKEMKEEGVQYFLQTLENDPSSEYDLNCIFENENFKIYEL